MGKGPIVIMACLTITMFGMLNLVGPTSAQESTPVAGATEVEIAPGVTFDLIPASEDPPTLYRLRIAAGATLLFAGDPAISLVYVESGALVLEMDADVSDTRPDTPSGSDDGDTASAVRQGDYFVLPPLVAGEIRNEGQEPASITIAAITPARLPAPAASTPAPE